MAKANRETRFLEKAGFLRTSSGKNFYMAGGMIRQRICSFALLFIQPFMSFWGGVRGGRFCKNVRPGISSPVSRHRITAAARIATAPRIITQITRVDGQVFWYTSSSNQRLNT